MFNCEMIPAENVGVKHAKWDREDGYKVPRDCYSSLFLRRRGLTLNIADKFRLHGAQYIAHLTGGSALHMNLEEHLFAAAVPPPIARGGAGEGDATTSRSNIPSTVCNDCGHIDKRYLKVPPLPLDEPRLPDARDRLHEAHQQLLAGAAAGGCAAVLQPSGTDRGRRRRAQRGGTATRRIADGHASLHRLRHRVPRDPPTRRRSPSTSRDAPTAARAATARSCRNRSANRSPRRSWSGCWRATALRSPASA